MKTWQFRPGFEPLSALFLRYLVERYALKNVDEALWGVLRGYILGNDAISTDDLLKNIPRIKEFIGDDRSLEIARQGILGMKEMAEGESKSLDGIPKAYNRERNLDIFDAKFTHRLGPLELVIADLVGRLHDRSRKYALRRIVRLYMLTDKRIHLKRFGGFVDEMSDGSEYAEEISKDWETFVAARARI